MKKLFYALICMLSVALFYGCGGNSSNKTESAENTETEVVDEDVADSEENTVVEADEDVKSDEQGEPITDKETLKKMGTFLSNFTELGMYDFTTKELMNSADHADIIRFGIWHNYVNNYQNRISNCKIKDCPHGSLTIDPKYVTESIKKYFDVDFKSHKTVDDDRYHYYYDGKLYHFEGADGEATYFANVKKATKGADGQVTMTGELYYAEDNSEILGTFKAVAKPYKFGGKDTWAIISMKSKID